MSSESQYTLQQLRKMNSTWKWNHILAENDQILYKIYPSGDLGGRYCKGLPAYYKRTPNVKRNFILIWY